MTSANSRRGSDARRHSAYREWASDPRTVGLITELAEASWFLNRRLTDNLPVSQSRSAIISEIYGDDPFVHAHWLMS